MCSTIAAATMSRSVSVTGRSFFPTFQPSANRTSLRNSSVTVGAQGMGIRDQQMANNLSASERQAAIETIKARQQARDAHLPGSKEYNVLHEEYTKAVDAYHNVGK
jgi:hypothetical protein